MESRLRKRTWMEINLDTIKNNYVAIRKQVPKGVKICCTIKADAYGHGAVKIGKFFEELGCDFFAVATVEEAIRLRVAGIIKPIMILGYSPVDISDVLAKYNLSQCVYSYEYGKALLADAKEKGVKLAVHIKIDTGMGRIGFIFKGRDEDKRIAEIAELCRSDSFVCEGIFTHFAISDDYAKGERFTRAQYDKFINIIGILEEKGIKPDLKHCSNSAGIISYPEYGLDMVRAGIALFGIFPSDSLKNEKIDLKQAFALKTIITRIETVEKNESVGYGRSYIASKKTKVATLPIGYADGFRRSNGDKSFKIYVKDKPCAVLGRVCMDQTMIDVSEVEEISVGDEITVFGNDSPISVYDYAVLHETIPYEVICNVGMRVPRVYYEKGEQKFITDYLLP